MSRLLLIFLCLLNFSVWAADAKKTDAKADTKPATKGKKMFAIFETNKGTFKAELFPDKSPLTVENFVGLAEGTKEWTDPKTNKKVKKPLYNGTIFHRVIKGFMNQGGDPLGNGTGGPGYEFKNENHPTLKFDKPGLLAMANAGPDTNGSQFFVTVGAHSHLNGGYTIFGQVDAKDMKVVEAINSTPLKGERPVEDVVLKSVKIERK